MNLAAVSALHHGHVVFAGKSQFDRPARCLRQQRGYGLVGKFTLAAETAADTRGNDTHLRHGQTQRNSGVHLHAGDALRRRPEGDLAVAVHFRQGRTGLHIHVILGRHQVFVFHDDVASVPGRIGVAFHELGETNGVRFLGQFIHGGVFVALFMDDRRARFQRFFDIRYGFEFFVFYLDKPQGLPRRHQVNRRHGRDRFSAVAHLIPRQGKLVLDEHADVIVWQVRSHQDRLDAGQRPGPGSINGQDPGMGVMTAEQGRVQHAGAGNVVSINGPPGRLFRSFDARDGGPDDRVNLHVVRYVRTHACSPSLTERDGIEFRPDASPVRDNIASAIFT